MPELHHVAVNVRDLGRSVAFYREVLGFRVLGEWTLAGAGMEQGMRLEPGTKGRNAFLRGPSVLGQIELVQWDSTAEARPVRPGDPGFMLLSFWVEADEIEDVHRRLGEAGGECYTAPSRVDIDGTEITVFVGEDPDGNLLEFLVRQGRASDSGNGRARDGENVQATATAGAL